MIPASPLEILQGVVQVAKRVYDQVQLVKSNKESWHSLVDLIKTVISSLEGLSTLPEQANFVKGLQSLESQIIDASTFLESMIGMKYWERFVKAGRHQKKIEGYRADVLELIPVLNLGLAAQQLNDKEQDRRNELADREAFVREQEEQLYKRQAENFKQRRDLEEVMRQQMQAFKEDLRKNWQAEPSPQAPPLPEQLMVKLYDITFEEKLSSSRLGAIHRGRWKGQEVLVKWIGGPLSASDKAQFIREAQIMSRLQHDNIVPFYGACFDTERMCIVTGVVEPLSLEHFSRFDFKERLSIGKDLAQGLQYLHSNNVLHSSIEPGNIGITRRGEGKWMDLSWVKTNLSSLASAGIAHEISVWQAPESWESRSKVTPEADVYSLGWLLWSLVAAKVPFNGERSPALYREIKSGKRERFSDDCPELLKNLISRCWDQNPRNRPRLTEVIRTLNRPECLEARPVSPTGEAYYVQGKTAHQAGDFATALACYTRSAEKNYPKSYNSLGFFSMEGAAGQAKDCIKAKKYFEKAAKAGYAPAMFNIGKLYERGELSEGKGEGKYAESQSNLTTALSWYKKAQQADTNEPRYRKKVETVTQTLGMSGTRK